MQRTTRRVGDMGGAAVFPQSKRELLFLYGTLPGVGRVLVNG